MNEKEMLIKQIESYVPFNEQEKKDKEVILKYLNDFDDIFDRTNEYAHVTSSAWAVNKERTKVLMIYHKIYDSWAWTGGHADGEKNPLETAIRELKEETGVKDVKVVNDNIFGLEMVCVNGHVKREKYVSSHEHINFTYLLEVDENETLVKKEDENLGVKWIDIDDLKNNVSEKWMLENIYNKYNKKVENLRKG